MPSLVLSVCSSPRSDIVTEGICHSFMSDATFFFTYLLHDIPKIWIIYLKKKSLHFFFTTMRSAWWFTVSKKNKYHFLFRFFVYRNTDTQTQNKIYHFLLLYLLKLKHRLSHQDSFRGFWKLRQLIGQMCETLEQAALKSNTVHFEVLLCIW